MGNIQQKSRHTHNVDQKKLFAIFRDELNLPYLFPFGHIDKVRLSRSLFNQIELSSPCNTYTDYSQATGKVSSTTCDMG